MEDGTDTLLRVSAKLQKAAKAPLVDGIVTLTPARVLWAPIDPNAASEASVDVMSITGKQGPQHTHVPLIQFLAFKFEINDILVYQRVALGLTERVLICS